MDLYKSLGATDEQNIHSTWKGVHIEHMQAVSLVCYRCEVYLRELHIGKTRLEEEIGRFLNMTMAWEYGENDMVNHNGLISSDWGMSADDFHATFLIAKSPSLVISSAFQSALNYQMVTVARKSLLQRAGWTAVFSAYSDSLWKCLVVLSGLFTFIFFKVSRAPWSTSILSLLSPLICQWFESPSSNHMRPLLVMWSMFCSLMTILYAGGFQASVCTLLPPAYEFSPELFGGPTSKLVTTTSIVASDGYKIAQALLGKTQTAERLQSISDASWDNGHCRDEYTNYNLSDAENPMKCNWENIEGQQINRLSPMTYLDADYRTSSVKIAYQSSSLFWVSPTVHLTQIQYTFPTYVSDNYFGKLVLPILSNWVALGLESYWVRIRTYGMQKTRNFENTRIPREEIKSSVVFEFEPVELSSLQPVLVVIYVLTGIAAGALVVELVYYSFAIMFNPIASLRKLAARLKPAMIIKIKFKFEEKELVRNKLKHKMYNIRIAKFWGRW